MSDKTPQAREIADRVLKWETDHAPSACDTAESPGIHLFDKLRAHMVKLVGVDGYQALLARARAKSVTEVGWMASIRVLEDGTVAGFPEATATLTEDEIARGRLVLLSNLFDLLTRLIGEELTVRLVRDIWPDVDLPAPKADVEEPS